MTNFITKGLRSLRNATVVIAGLAGIVGCSSTGPKPDIFNQRSNKEHQNIYSSVAKEHARQEALVQDERNIAISRIDARANTSDLESKAKDAPYAFVPQSHSTIGNTNTKITYSSASGSTRVASTEMRRLLKEKQQDVNLEGQIKDEIKVMDAEREAKSLRRREQDSRISNFKYFTLHDRNFDTARKEEFLAYVASNEADIRAGKLIETDSSFFIGSKQSEPGKFDRYRLEARKEKPISAVTRSKTTYGKPSQEVQKELDAHRFTQKERDEAHKIFEEDGDQVSPTEAIAKIAGLSRTDRIPTLEELSAKSQEKRINSTPLTAPTNYQPNANDENNPVVETSVRNDYVVRLDSEFSAWLDQMQEFVLDNKARNRDQDGNIIFQDPNKTEDIERHFTHYRWLEQEAFKNLSNCMTSDQQVPDTTTIESTQEMLGTVLENITTDFVLPEDRILYTPQTANGLRIIKRMDPNSKFNRRKDHKDEEKGKKKSGYDQKPDRDSYASSSVMSGFEVAQANLYSDSSDINNESSSNNLNITHLFGSYLQASPVFQKIQRESRARDLLNRRLSEISSKREQRGSRDRSRDAASSELDAIYIN